ALGCDRPNFVQLVDVEFGEDAEGGGGPAGFTCRLGSCQNGVCPTLLFERASEAARPSPGAIALNPDFSRAHALGSAVVDFITLAAGPSDSDPFVVISRCTKVDAGGTCSPIERHCFPIDMTKMRDTVDAEGAAASGHLFVDIFKQLHDSGALVSADA